MHCNDSLTLLKSLEVTFHWRLSIGVCGFSTVSKEELFCHKYLLSTNGESDRRIGIESLFEVMRLD